ncbi:MAG: tetratricopeptide repeat protein [Bernardetiaceae bacterium]|nr:tetratricopeptide repeat protein [Bernardetiaceae bacterium]
MLKKICLLSLLCWPYWVAAQATNELLAKADQLSENGNAKEAVAIYSQVITRDTRSVQAYHGRGWQHLSLGQYAEAIRDFTKVLDLAKGGYEAAYHGRGIANFQLGNLPEALSDYLKDTKLNPRDEVCQNNLGALYEKMGKYNEALAAYEKAIALKPDYRTAINNKNELINLMMRQKKQQADQGREEVLTAKQYYDKGYEAGSVDDFVTAIRWFDRAIAADRNYKLAYDNRGYAKFKLNRYAEALADLNKSIDISLSKWTFNQRGLVKMKQNNPTEAMKDFEAALRIDPEYAPALESKKICLQLIGAGSRLEDKVPPVIDIYTPSLSRGVDAVRYDQETTVTGRARDNSGVESVIVNGVTAQLATNGDFLAKIKIGAGRNQVIVVARDKRGNQAEKAFFTELKANNNGSEAPVVNPVVTKHEITGLGTNYALLVGTDEYRDPQWPKLNNPIADAKAVGNELAQYYNYKTELITNPTNDALVRKLREYAKRTYQPNDQLFIFIASHGQFDELTKQGHLVTTDSERDDETFNSYVSHVNLRNLINNIPCKHIFIVIDACFSGTFDPVIAKRGGPSERTNLSRSEFVARKLQHTTRRYLTSGGKEYVSDGIPGRNSPFARRLLEALRSYGGADGLLNLDELMNFVVDSGVEPKPRFGNFGDDEPGSDFFFVSK